MNATILRAYRTPQLGVRIIELTRWQELVNKRFILFDAVSTVIYPEPDVFSAYHKHALSFGSQLTRDEVKTGFHRLRQELFDSELPPEAINFDTIELVSSDQIEFDLWRCLVEQLFSDVADPLGLFHALWGHFALASSWRVFDDVAPCWQQLKKAGFKIGIASNFDSRLFELCKQLSPLDQADFIACSAKSGYRKPDKRFFETIESQIGPLGQDSTQHPIMIGDDRVNDFLAPQHLGWQSFLINRKQAQACSRTLNSLLQLPDLLVVAK